MTNPSNFLSKRTLTRSFSLSLAISALFTLNSGASLSDEAYEAALKIAQKKVSRLKSLNSRSANALSFSWARTLLGRNYQVGDRWEVVAWKFNPTTARMTGDPESLNALGGSGGVFQYEVVSVQSAPTPEVVIEVRQKEEFGFSRPDSRVQVLKLRMTPSMSQSEKTYTMLTRAGEPKNIRVSPDGIRSSITPLELFPLDVPELATAENQRAASTPHMADLSKLPPPLQSIATRLAYRPDPARSLWFEQDDFFGRPIQALWQEGDPWPAYYRTSNGVAILIRKGRGV